MKKNLIVLIAIVLSIGLQSCDQESLKPSGNITTEVYDISSFTGLDISSCFKAYVTFSDTEETVSIEADDNLQDYIIVEKNGNTLEVRLKNNISIRGNETLEVHISTKTINDFKASSDAEVFLQNELDTEDLTIKLSGDSKFDGALNIVALQADLRGDSKMNVSGSVDKLDAVLKGDSEIENYSFSVKDLLIDLSGDSKAYLTVTEIINVKASGDSNLHYKGDAVINSQELSGDSKLIKED